MIPVTIHDHIADDFGTIIITDEEIVAMGARWGRDDAFIIRMQSNRGFHRCSCWGDLSLRQLQHLLMLHMAVGEDGANDLVERGMRIVLTALCVHLCLVVDGEINQITIHRFDQSEVHIDFSASITAHRLPRKHGQFRIAVDNA